MPDRPDTRFRRLREKGCRDFSTACQIIDAARICHVGFVHGNFPYVVPMAHARDGNRLLIHGSVASRLIKNLAAGLNCCVTITHFDGLVLARSAFNSSMNYRSVMILGQAHAVLGEEDKARGLGLLTEHLLPGRLVELRPSTRQEIHATTLLALPIETFTVKIGAGPPDDPAKDLGAGIWAGTIPIRLTAGTPQAAPDLDPHIPLPGYLQNDWYR